MDAGGATVLILTLIALGVSFASAGGPSIPAWMAITQPRVAPAIRSVDEPVLAGMPVSATPAVQTEPYSEISSTKLQLSEYALHEVRLRLGGGRTAADVDTLLRSKAKSLRDAGIVVLVKLYPADSDATSTDEPLVTYVAADIKATAYGDPVLARTNQIEPDLFRTALPK